MGNMRKPTLPRWIKNRYRFLLAATSVSAVTALLLITQLTTLFAGPNQFEGDAVQALSVSRAWQNPIDAPYYLVARFFDLFFSPLTALRLTSVGAGLATALLLSYTLRQWFSDRVAVAGILFIVTSSWFLAFSRIGAPYVMGAFWLALLVALGTWRTYTTKPLLTDSLLAFFAGLSLYTPRYTWLILISFIVLSLRRYRQFFIIPRKHQWFLPFIFVAGIIPLIYASIRDISVLDPILGIDSLPVTLREFASRAFDNVSQIFFRGTVSPGINLGRLPLLDIFSVILVALGVYFFERQIRLRRSQFLFAVGALMTFLISLSSFAIGNLTVLFPIVMFFAVGGIVELLERWLKGFPRNPIARSVGVCVVVIAIGFTSFYHLQRYFVAWANNPDAIQAHSPDNY